MTLTELIAAVRVRSGLASTDPQATDAIITALLLEATNAISSERDWPWLETSATLTTASGTQAYSPPSGWVKTKSLQISGYDPLDGSESKSTLDHRYPVSTSTGQPVAFVVSGDQIRLYPTPGAVYSIAHVYVRQETQLANGSDEPLMPAWAQASIADWATSLLFTRIREPGLASEWMGRAQDWLRRLADNDRRTTAPRRVRVRDGSWV